MLVVATTALPLISALLLRTSRHSGTISTVQVALLLRSHSQQEFFVAMLLASVPIFAAFISAWLVVRTLASDRDNGVLAYQVTYSTNRAQLLFARLAAVVTEVFVIVSIFMISCAIFARVLMPSGPVTATSGNILSPSAAHVVEIHGVITVALLSMVTCMLTACLSLGVSTGAALVLGNLPYTFAIFSLTIPGLNSLMKITPYYYWQSWAQPLAPGIFSGNFYTGVFLAALWIFVGTAVVLSGWTLRLARPGD